MTADLIVDLFLGKRQTLRLHARRYNGMVVSDFAAVEHFLRLRQFLFRQWRCQFRIRLKSLQNVWTFRINVVTQISGIDTRISGVFLLVEALDGLQGLVGTETVFLVTFHLQRGQVEQARRCFLAFLLRDVGDCKILSLNGLQILLTFFN